MLVSINLNADFQGPTSSNSAVDPNASWAPKSQQINTVAKLKYAENVQNVIITGHMIKKLSPEIYVFEDPTGKINVRINKNAWNNLDIEPTTLVRISGIPEISCPLNLGQECPSYLIPNLKKKVFYLRFS